MNVLVTGATGFVGRYVVDELLKNSHHVIVTTRDQKKAEEIFARRGQKVEIVVWHPRNEELPFQLINRIDGIINLLGENLAAKRWSETQKEKILKSRTGAAQSLLASLKKRDRPLPFMVQASAIGYYAINEEKALNEQSPQGKGFLADVCKAWEQDVQAADSTLIERKVITRIGIVLGREGGALQKLAPLFQLALGGVVAGGLQMMSWIHVKDLARLIVQAGLESSYSGIYNAVAPHPVSNKVFTKELAEAVSRPAIFPVPAFALKLAMGEMSTIVLDGQNVISTRLEGFTFKFPEIRSALRDLFQRQK
jgi:uncharacterized protein